MASTVSNGNDRSEKWQRPFEICNDRLRKGNLRRLCVKAAKYEIQKPLTWRATLFRCKFGSMSPVFHLARTCRATKTFEESCCEKKSADLL